MCQAFCKSCGHNDETKQNSCFCRFYVLVQVENKQVNKYIYYKVISSM